MSPAARLEAAKDLARALQRRIQEATGGLTCSIGVAENKFLAKVASDLQKPEGLVAVTPGAAAEFLAPLPIERLWGVGPRTAEHLHRLGLRWIGEVARLKRQDLEVIAGVELGRHLHDLARGIDHRAVVTESEARSLSQETTFAAFIPPRDLEAIHKILFSLADGVAERLRGEGLWGRTVTLKVRDERFETCTRSLTLPAPTQLVEEIFAAASRLFAERIKLGERRVRLLGIAVKNFASEPLRQLDLFDAGEPQRRRAAEVARLLDQVREKAGDGAITRARLLGRPRRKHGRH
jgi:DNA polymerase-4